jgi:hypothetical protein
MNRPEQHFRARLAVLMVGGALIAALFPMAGSVLAATSITAATNGGAISADTATPSPGTGAWTALGGPVVNEGAAADIPNSGTVTLTLTGSYEFRTTAQGGAVGAAFTATGACALTATTPIITAATITTTLGGTATSGTERCHLTFSGIQVRPIVGVMPNTGALAFSGAITGAAGTLAMVAGTPILQFTTQPSSTATAATAFAAQPIVESVDRFDNPRAADSVTLAIKSGTGTAGAILTCTTNPVATNASGLATFAGCKIDKSGTGYLLRATATGATAVDSTAIAVSPGAAAQLGFATQPARGIPGIAFAAQPVVAIQDAQGNTVTSASTTVTLSLTTGSGTLSCTGGLNKGTTAGVATFAGCRLDAVGVGFKITAAAPSYANVPSASFDVADRLAFTTQPAGAVGGVAFTTQPVVAVRAGASATAVNDNGTVVTLGIKALTGAAGATLTCTSGLTRTAVAGVATFSGCWIDKSSPTGNPYVLVASSLSLAGAESSSLAVVAGAASKLLFTVQPAATNSGVVFAAAPAVSITDAGGNVVTTSTASVTLALGANPGAGTLTCTGGLTKAAVAGVATFTGCSINNAGTGYTLVAASTGLTSATSSAFTVTAPAAVISLVRSTGMVTYGGSVGFSIQFASLGARTVFLEHTYVGSAWTTVATLTTNASGFASTSYAPTRTGYYRVRFAGTPDLSAAFSNVVLVGTRQTVTLFPTHTGVMTIDKGRTITFRSTIRPLRPDLVASSVTFRFYQKVSGSWVLKYERHVSVDAAGTARTAFRFGVSGSWYVMAFAARSPYNSVSRFSQREVFVVH